MGTVNRLDPGCRIILDSSLICWVNMKQHLDDAISLNRSAQNLVHRCMFLHSHAHLMHNMLGHRPRSSVLVYPANTFVSPEYIVSNQTSSRNVSLTHVRDRPAIQVGHTSRKMLEG
jgi:hypothetical protein